MDEKPKLSRRVMWGVAASLLLLSVVAAAVWFSGHTVWTDGQFTRVAGGEARLREVLWTVPKPLDSDLNSAGQQYEPSLSPDGSELYFVRGKPGRGAHVYVSYRRDNAWTAPALVKAINGPTDDLGPRVTPDGRFLLFSSDRPGGAGGYDLWAAPREKGGWGAPFNLGPGVNTEFNELNPDPTPDGRHLIFSTNRKAAGREQTQAWRGTIRESDGADYDLWSATTPPVVAAAATQPTTAPGTRPGTQPSAIPIALAFTDAAEIPGVNTSASEGASCMSPAGDFLYFASNRAGGAGKFDLYRCRVREGGRFGPVENVGPPINTADNEADPSMAMVGFRVYFSSDRNSPAGVYTLHTSDSHEVFSQREGRPFPRLGWSFWSLLLSALLLIPLILALRGIEGRHLNTLQRCLVLSLLLHAAITFILSFVMVSRDVVRSIGRGTGGEIALNLNLPKDVEIGLAVRGQLSSASELPVTVADPAPVARAVEATLAGDAEPVRVAAPAATAMPARTLELPRANVPAKPIATGDPPRVAPLDAAAFAAAAPLANVGPTASVDRLTQTAPHALEATEGPPRTVARAQPRILREARPGGDLAGATPSVAIGAAVTAAMAPRPPAARVGGAALPGDASAVTPESMVPDNATDLAIADLPTQDTKTARLNTGPAPSLPATDVRPTAARLEAAARDVGAAPKELDAVATPLLPTTAPTSTSIAAAPSTRPSAVDAVASLGEVQPAGSTAAVSDAAPAPPILAGPVPSNAKLSPANVTPEPPRGADVSSDVSRQATASASAPAPPPLPRMSPPATAAPPQRDAARPPDVASLPPARPVEITVGDRVAPSAARSPGPLEIASAAVPVPSTPAPARGAGDPKAAAERVQNGIEPILASRRAMATESPAPAPVTTASTAPPASPQQSKPLASPSGLDGGPTPPLRLTSDAPAVSPDASLASTVSLSLVPSPGIVTAPASSPFPRSLEQRQPRIEKLGGNEKSESAVDRGLAYLATQQEPDGRWTLVLDNSRPTGRRPKSYHDMANTGLACLAFLARDNSPNKAGPYSRAVAKGLDYLIEQQEDNGDLRGPPHLRGEGSRRGDMYDHAIATLALAEAALMTGGDKRYTDAALRGARFIVLAQDPRSGGWRYIPGESGDSSVFGWQVMALHAAEQLGFQTPDRTRQLAARYIGLASRGDRKMLAGYQPGKPPTPTMTAEILYGRMLLGQKLDPEDIREATDYLADQPPDPREPSLYYWYYASLCMLQIQSPEWKEWNVRTRDALIALQSRGGATDGSWDADPRYAERGGRVYMTAIAVLTLEVYYRYLPLLDRAAPAP